MERSEGAEQSAFWSEWGGEGEAFFEPRMVGRGSPNRAGRKLQQ